MSAQQHTPGPWQVFNHDQGTTILSAERSSLAEVFAVDQGSHHANADLIAAAPELLAALIDAESMLDQIRHLRMLDNDTWDAIDKTVDAARTALAKVES